MADGSRVYVSQELLKSARQVFMEFLLQGGRVVREVLRPILELTVVIPGLLLAYFPVKPI